MLCLFHIVFIYTLYLAISVDFNILSILHGLIPLGIHLLVNFAVALCSYYAYRGCIVSLLKELLRMVGD